MNGEDAAAKYMVTVLTDLGPAFVKIGQAVASRPDIIPPHYLKQLETLQVCLLL
jgi:predicted unusual protein kinase regulating ubiquinone biosynthesis (AarF/ABC1/UbiB family)